MEEKFLPIGSIVKLKNATKKIMIIGFCAMDQDHKNKIFDYSACLYPEGLISSNETMLFDHKDIEKIYFLGYVDDEEAAFKSKLNALITGIGKYNV